MSVHLCLAHRFRRAFFLLAQASFSRLSVRRFSAFAVLVFSLVCVNASTWADTIPPGLHAGDVYERIFVTSSTYTVVTSTVVPPDDGTFGGLAAADYSVTLSAYEAGLIPNWNGTDLLYHAILSTGAVDARDRITVQGPLYNMNNELIAANSADLWDGSIDHAIRYDEFGNSIAAGSRVWSGTSPIGTKDLLSRAGDWVDPNTDGLTGDPLSTASAWISDNSRNANTPQNLYGVSGPITVAPEPSSVNLMMAAMLSLAVLTFSRLPSRSLSRRSHQ